MSDWRDRIQEPAITTADGERYAFQVEDVSKDVIFKTNKFTFGDRDGTLVQDFGLGETGFPLTVIFTGADYDEVADAFELSLTTIGPAFLEHPIYGNASVVIESYTRRDPLKSAANQALFDMVMTETIIPAAPVSVEQGRTSIVDDIDDFVQDSAEEFTPNFDRLADAASSKSRILGAISAISSGLEAAIESTQEVSDAWNSAEDFINDNIDELLTNPVVLSAALQSLIRLPTRSTLDVKARIDAYLTTLQSFTPPTPLEGFLADLFNTQQEVEIFSTALLNGASESALFGSGDFLTRSDATESGQELVDAYQSVQLFLDTEEQNSLGNNINIRYSVSEVVAGGIKSITSLTAGQLVQISFSLKQERVITLPNDETIIPLVHRLYGGKIDDPVDENIPTSKIDFLIDTNQLTPDEIIVMRKGRQIRYYV